MSLKDRIRKLEAKLKHKDAPTPEKYLQTHRRQVARLHAKIAGFFGGSTIYTEEDREIVEGDTPEDARRDADTVKRWGKAQGVSEEEIASHAEIARQKLQALGRKVPEQGPREEDRN